MYCNTSHSTWKNPSHNALWGQETIKNDIISYYQNLSEIEWSHTIEELSKYKKNTTVSLNISPIFFKTWKLMKRYSAWCTCRSFLTRFTTWSNERKNDNSKLFSNWIMGSRHDRSKTLPKIWQFHLISWCGVFVQRRSFRRVSGDSPSWNSTEIVPCLKTSTPGN